MTQNKTVPIKDKMTVIQLYIVLMVVRTLSASGLSVPQIRIGLGSNEKKIRSTMKVRAKPNSLRFYDRLQNS